MKMVPGCSVLSSLNVYRVRMSRKRRAQGWEYLAETDGGRLFTETLAAEVKAVFADETGLVCTQTTEGARRRNQSERSQGEKRCWSSHHWREPFPYFLGRENQTASCVMVG